MYIGEVLFCFFFCFVSLFCVENQKKEKRTRINQTKDFLFENILVEIDKNYLSLMSSSTLVPIVIKHGSTTYHIHLENSPDDNKRKQFELISQQIRIPTDRLKLIYKGKRFTEQNWHETVLVPNMIFLSIGEQNEDESDLNAKDIDCIVHQLKVDRNAAIRALKLHPDVVDAILYLGNK